MEERIKLYKAMIWMSDSVPGERVEVQAPSLEDAKKKLEAKYGVGHVFNLHCEEDAKKPRSPTN
jgi:hypothetical protein